MKLKHVALDYFPEFKCLADKCNYTCCTGWRVGLTRQEYMKTKNLRTTKQLAETIKTGMKRTKDENQKFYAFMNLKENGDCPFLTENKLCALQLEHGYNVLSNTCKTFPRRKNISPVQWEELCTTGCEQVVNLLLQRPQGLRLIEIDSEEVATVDDAELEQYLNKNPRARFYKEIQMLFMGILQNRSYSLDHRMILLGLASRNLDKANTPEEIIAFFQKSLPLLKHSPEMETQLKNMQTSLAEGIKTALPFTMERFRMQRKLFEKESYYAKALQDISKNIDIEFTQEDSAKMGTFDVSKYICAKQHFTQIECADYLMENVMVNSLIQRQFPIPYKQQGTSVWEEYLHFFAEYNILKVLTTAYMADKNEPSDLVHIVTICGRTMLHDKMFCNGLVEQLHKQEKDTLAHIAMMLCC